MTSRPLLLACASLALACSESRSPGPETARSAVVEPPAAPGPTDVQRLGTLAEGQLRLGNASRALAVLAEADPSSRREPALVRARAWAHFILGDAAALEAELARGVIGTLEGEWLAADLALRQRRGGPARLRDLWWSEPDSAFGLAALRSLAGLAREGYAEAERRAVVAAVPAPAVDTYLTDDASVRETLATLSRSAGKGRLRAELALARGVLALRDEEFAEAARELAQSLDAELGRDFARGVELRLAEALRRRGAYGEAAAHFARLSRGDDAVAARARAEAALMAVEHQRYPEAERLYRQQLLDNPLGEARARALWGLGWVAFRTGAFAEARRFFGALVEESPYGALAPSAVYWGARALEERGARAESRAELAALVARFPFDAYAYRARALLGRERVAPAKLPERHGLPELVAVGEVSTRRARGLVAKAWRRAAELGPEELLAVAAAAYELGDEALTRAARDLACRRFAQPAPSCVERPAAKLVATLRAAATSERVPPHFVEATARAASGLDVGRVGDHGQLGPLQLDKRRLVELWREAHRKQTPSAAQLASDEAVRLAVRYLGRTTRPFDRRLEYALAAVHAGPGAVTRWREGRGDLPLDIFAEEIPYPETREFVQRALGELAILEALAPEPVSARVAQR